MDEGLAKTVNDLISGSHKLKGADFKKRVKYYEDLHNPKKKHLETIQNHAHDVIFGLKDKGAYHIAQKTNDEQVKKPSDKLNKSHVTKILESYADGILGRVDKNYKKSLEKHKEAGATDEEIRELKNNLLNAYLKDEHGRGLNLLSNEFIKQYVGETKADMVTHIQQLGETSKKMYNIYLTNEATTPLMEETDIFNIHSHTKDKFKKAGLTPKKRQITKSAHQIFQDYATHLRKGDMGQRGYEDTEIKYDKAA